MAVCVMWTRGTGRYSAFSDVKILQLQGFHSLIHPQSNTFCNEALHITKMAPSQTPKQYTGLCWHSRSSNFKMAKFSKIRNCLRASMYQEGLVGAPFCPLRRKHHQIWQLQWTHCSKETDNVRVVVVRGRFYLKLFLLKGDLSIYCYGDLDPMLGLLWSSWSTE